MASLPVPLVLRGRKQIVQLYGHRGAPPVIVSSGDGGWIHLGPHVAQTLAAHGFFVVGFNVKSYLESFTTARSTLTPDDVSSDFRSLVTFAAGGADQRPILVGVSEGAGLSVLAATNPGLQPQIAGVVGLGLPDINELAWRWTDSLIFLTHGVPNEPSFSTSAVIARAAPVPIAAVHSDRDEFVPLGEIERVMAAAHEPKRLWIVNASDHRFSNNERDCDRRLFDAIDWIHAQRSAALRPGEVH
jgi:alpha-beta hydrolase superfamily lysophospholipase